MLSLACLVVCVQACLIQSVFSECYTPYPVASTLVPMTSTGALDMIAAPFVASVTAPLTESFLVPTAADALSAYGGAGIGETAVAGDLPSIGTTGLVGQVPILGAVEFGGIVAAAGTVSIAANCACGCPGLI